MNYFEGEYCLIKGENGYIKVPFFHMASKAVIKDKNGKEIFRDKRAKYAYQFERAAIDIKDGKKESLISLDSSLIVMELMDEIRKELGVVYSCDQ